MMRPITGYAWAKPRVIATLCAAGLILAGCGSSSSSSSSSSTTSSSKQNTSSASGTPAATASTSTASGPAPKGDPVKVMVESSVNTPIGSYPGEWGAAQAAAAAVNKAGGVNGHPLNVVLCNAGFSVNGAVACARKAVADNVVAYAGFSPFAFAITPILSQAGITVTPWISNLADARNPKIVPVNGAGALTEQLANPYAAKLAGAKSFAITQTEYPGLDATIALEKQAGIKLGMQFKGVIKLGVAQTDTTATVQQLSALKPDAILANSNASQIATMIQGAQGTGFTPTWISASGAFEVPSLDDAAKLTQKLWIVSATPAFQRAGSSSIPAVTQYASEMNAAAAAGVSNAAPGNRDSSAFYVWASLHGIADVAKAVTGAITTKSFAAAIAKAKDVDVVGLWKWTPSAKGPVVLPHVTDGGEVYVSKAASDGTLQIQKRVPALTVLGLK